MSFVTKWIKIGKISDFVFLGKETIATASGCHVTFYNLSTKEERIENFNDPVRGEGACCLAGHSGISIFSTAERRHKPRILVYTYPDITKIAECKLEEDFDSYLSCCFHGTENLLSLTSAPKFQLIAWLWRTGDKIGLIDTAFSDLTQTIRSSVSAPYMMYQFASTSGRLVTYDVYSYSKKAVLVKNNVQCTNDKIVCACWTNSGNLLLADEFQNVYIVSGDGKKIQTILSSYSNIKIKKSIIIVPFNNQFLLADDNSRLTCYSRSIAENVETYTTSWSIVCEFHPLKISLIPCSDSALVYDESGWTRQLNLLSPEKSPNPWHRIKPASTTKITDLLKLKFEPVFNNSFKFKLMELLKPDEKYIALVDELNNLIVLDMVDGHILDTFEVNYKVLDLKVHPYFAMVVVSTVSGKCASFVFHNKSLRMISSMYLQKEPLNLVKFSKNGNTLGSASTESRNIFLLKTGASVFFNTNLEESIVDFLIYDDDQKTIQLIILIQTQTVTVVGNCIEIITLNKWENSIIRCNKIYFEECYQSLHYDFTNQFDFIATPYLSKQINFFKFEDNYEELVMVDAISSTHALRKFSVNTSNSYLITSGYDGSIVLRDVSKYSKVKSTLSVHCCQEGGVKNAVASSCGKVMACLGRNGSLLGIELCKVEENSKDTVKKTEEDSILWKSIVNMSTLPSEDNLTWLEHEKIRKRQKEKESCEVIRNKILRDLNFLKLKIKEMLNLNEQKSVLARLPISVFDLSEARRKEKMDAEIKRQNEDHACTRERISSIEKVINYLMVNFWDSMEVNTSCLVAFNSKIEVCHYPLHKEGTIQEPDDHLIELFSIPLSNTLSIKNCSDEIEKSACVKVNNSKDSDSESNYLFLKYSSDLVFTGSTSFKWIEDDESSNQLFTDILCNDAGNENSVTESLSKEYKLKKIFNEKFSEAKRLKKDLLEKTKQRLDRLNECLDELKNFFGVQGPECCVHQNLEWNPRENSENIITILDGDIPPELCVIESEMTEETRKNSTIAEDKLDPEYLEEMIAFRSMKLEEFMDGVLEIRWTDELKQDVPKPSCLINKNPTSYNEDDLEAIKVYKQRVEKLEMDRKKYKNLLEEEIQELNESIKADIEDFDSKIESLALEKIKINSAILQEFLLRQKDRCRRFCNAFESVRQTRLVNEILENLQPEVSTEPIEQTVSELRIKYETLNKRDKTLESKFRNEFSGIKQPLVEHLSRQYKRRPKLGQISCPSLTYLAEANECLMTGKKSDILPQEYHELLRGLDALDVMPSNLPPQIDSNLWQALCKLRRNKLDIEIKLRMAALELNEAEQTFFYLQKFNSAVQSRIYYAKNSTEEVASKLARSMGNPEIQLVLKIAQVEVQTTGSPEDFGSTTIVTYDHLRQVNGEILEAGHKKISALRSLINLRKLMLRANWEYKCMLMKIKHSKEHLHDVQKTKVGKEMLKDLRKKNCGKKTRHRDAAFYEKVLKSVRKKFDRMLNEKKTGLLRLIIEVKHWSKMNSELLTRLEMLSMERQEKNLILTEDRLRKINRAFHEKQVKNVMERNRLVDEVKRSQVELMSLQNQLELLRLKTYPTLRFKNVNYDFSGDWRRSVTGETKKS